MALIEYGALVTSIKGKVGGYVFQRGYNSNILRAKGSCKKSTSVGQQLQQQSFFNLRKQWSALLLSQKVAWNSFAHAHPRTDKFGIVRAANGSNWFSSINSNRLSCGLSVLSDPPTYTTPVGVPNFTFEFGVHYQYLQWSPAFAHVSDYLYIFATQPLTGAGTAVNRYLRKLLVVAPGTSNAVVVSAAYYSVFGFPLLAFGGGNQWTVYFAVQSVNAASGVASSLLIIPFQIIP